MKSRSGVKQSQTTRFSTIRIRINNNGKRERKENKLNIHIPNRFAFRMHWQSGLFFWRYRFDLWRQTLNWQLTYGVNTKFFFLKYSQCFKRILFLCVWRTGREIYFIASEWKRTNGTEKKNLCIESRVFHRFVPLIFFGVCKFILSNQIFQKLIFERKYDRRFSPSFVCVGVSIKAI